MANIFISTNGTDPQNCFQTDEEKDTIESYLVSQNFPSEVAKEIFSNIYLILDTITQDKLPNSVTINKEEDYLLYHKATTTEIKNLFKENNKTEGHHTQNVADYYQPVFKVLLDNTETHKFNKILQIIAHDPEEETLSEDIFNAIYEKKDEETIEKAVSKRDKYIKGKGKN
jgi:hypothetical protein